MPVSQKTVDTLLAGLPRVREWQEQFYRDLHRHPELSHQETETSRKAADRLRDFGYEVHAGIGGTGVVGVLANGSGPAVLLRADLDALPVQEATGLDYAEHGARRRCRRQRRAGDACLRPRRARRDAAGRGPVARRGSRTLDRHGDRTLPARRGNRRRGPRNGRRRPGGVASQGRRRVRPNTSCPRRPAASEFVRVRSCPQPTACASPFTAVARTVRCRRPPSTRWCSPR